MKYLKVIFSNTSRYNSFQYKIGEVNYAPFWNPTATTPKEMGGLNFSDEENIIRYLHNGDIIYDVEIPEDAEVVSVKECATPYGVFRSNKIIIKNPQKVTDEMALEFYKKSTIPEEAYPKALGGVSVMNFYKTANAIFNDKVNNNNIEFFLSEWHDFIDRPKRIKCNATVIEIDKRLRDFFNNKL